MLNQRKLLLIAASGLAREVLSVIRSTHSHELVGILDDDVTLAGTYVGGLPVLGRVDSAINYPDAQLLVCAGRGRSRRAIVDRLATMGVTRDRFATILDPSVSIPESCDVGSGSIVLAHSALTADVVLGRHVVVMPNVTMTHNDRVCDYSTLCAGVSLGGTVTVGRSAYIGMNASVREGVTVGAGSVIGMGAVVLDTVAELATVVGNPARELISGRSTSLAREASTW